MWKRLQKYHHAKGYISHVLLQSINQNQSTELRYIIVKIIDFAESIEDGKITKTSPCERIFKNAVLETKIFSRSSEIAQI